MRLRMTPTIIAAVCLAVMIIPPRPSSAAETLPSQISDAAYWKVISDFSEPDRYHQFTVNAWEKVCS
jgi:hypothetical protein